MLRHVDLPLKVTPKSYAVDDLPEPADVAKHLPGDAALPALRHHLVFANWSDDERAVVVIAAIGTTAAT